MFLKEKKCLKLLLTTLKFLLINFVMKILAKKTRYINLFLEKSEKYEEFFQVGFFLFFGSWKVFS